MLLFRDALPLRLYRGGSAPFKKWVRCFYMGALTHYEVLGIKQTASKGEIKSAYMDLSKKLHPDANKSDKDTTEQFQRLTSAYTVLSKETTKKQYDEAIGVISYSNRGPKPYPGNTKGHGFQEGNMYYHYPNAEERYKAARKFWEDNDPSAWDEMYENKNEETDLFGNKKRTEAEDVARMWLILKRILAVVLGGYALGYLFYHQTYHNGEYFSTRNDLMHVMKLADQKNKGIPLRDHDETLLKYWQPELEKHRENSK